jgi:ArsR family transcriptional regulator, arsenate/arsenite/antimonite-responsive transcriptional repressor
MHMNEVFKALADPTRREVLRLLRSGEMTAGELSKRFDMTKPSMSHHFATLKQADLIASRREGQQVYYFLNTTVVEDVLSLFLDLFGASGAPSSSAVGTSDSTEAGSENGNAKGGSI